MEFERGVEFLCSLDVLTYREVRVIYADPCCGGLGCLVAKLDALSEGQSAGPVDCAGLPPHVRLPRVGAGFATTAGVLLAAKGTANLRAASANIDVGNAAI